MAFSLNRLFGSFFDLEIFRFSGDQQPIDFERKQKPTSSVSVFCSFFTEQHRTAKCRCPSACRSSATQRWLLQILPPACCLSPRSPLGAGRRNTSSGQPRRRSPQVLRGPVCAGCAYLLGPYVPASWKCACLEQWRRVTARRDTAVTREAEAPSTAGAAAAAAWPLASPCVARGLWGKWIMLGFAWEVR